MIPENEGDAPRSRHPSWLLEPVLAVHASALVHVGLGYVGAATTGYALLDALADEATHQKGAALYAPIGLGVPGDIRLSQNSNLSLGFSPLILPERHPDGLRSPDLELVPLALGRVRDRAGAVAEAAVEE